ncbi:MAG TPA: c-type cytochrome biogenesis protein CcmI [Casimicrobiaceae bacterium]|nr:c-type cytochrome biogenesis protein CcmI [Casimicrobiaceae bacterium]
MISILLFWFIALALVAAMLIVLARPLLRGGKPRQDAAPPELDATTAVYRDQKRQLDDDLAAGAVTASEHAAAQEELVHRLGAEIAKQPSAAEAGATRTPWIAIIVLVAVVPVASVLLYQILGNPGAIDAQTARPRITDQDVRAMVEQLAERMQTHPDDPKGWLLLARSYAALGRYSDAAAAFGEAAKRSPDDAQLYADWADAAAMDQQRKLVGKPEELIARALAIDPNNRKALALSATALLERGDVDASLARWRELRQKLAPDSDEAREIDKVIAEIGGAKSAASAGAPAKGTITGRIEVDPKIASRIAPGDTVFVLARSADGGRVPLAVTRMRARELPATFHLDDSMGMIPEAKLSATPRVVVEARVSKSGNAKASAGDLRGISAPVTPGDANVRVVIGEVVQ